MQLSNPKKGFYSLFFLFVTLTVLFFLLSWISGEFHTDVQPLDRPILRFFVLFVCVYFVYVWLVFLIKNSTIHISVIFAVGIILRIILFASTPVLETDYYRYIWDGYVTYQGLNPYEFSPLSLSRQQAGIEEHDLEYTDFFSTLQYESVALECLSRVNHPEVKTIYPPVVPLFFAWIWGVGQGMSVNVLITLMRVHYLLIDIFVFIVLAFILQQQKYSTNLIAFVWLNPVWIWETYNTLHFDILVSLFLLTAMWLWFCKKWLVSSIFFALSILTKLYPIALIPFLFSKEWIPWKWLGGVIGFCFLFIIFLPGIGLLSDGGWVEYSQHWEMHSVVFSTIKWCLLFWIISDMSHLTSVILCSCFLVSIITYLWLDQSFGLMKKCGIVIIAILLLSPTAFPWYTVWVIPFLPFLEIKRWIFLPLIFFVYYLRFWAMYFEPSVELFGVHLHAEEVFDHVISPISYLLFLGWNGYTYWNERELKKAGKFPLFQF